jgi:hypothetical protein
MTNAGQIDVKLGLNSEEFIQGLSSSNKELFSSVLSINKDIDSKGSTVSNIDEL